MICMIYMFNIIIIMGKYFLSKVNLIDMKYMIYILYIC